MQYLTNTCFVLALTGCCTFGFRPKSISIEPSFDGIDIVKSTIASFGVTFTVEFGCCISKKDKSNAEELKTELVKEFKRVIAASSKLDKEIQDPKAQPKDPKEAEKRKTSLEKQKDTLWKDLANYIELSKSALRVIQDCGNNDKKAQEIRKFEESLPATKVALAPESDYIKFLQNFIRKNK